MADPASNRVADLLAQEYRAAQKAVEAGQIDLAWHHLERAHILAQTRLWPHCQSHWKMLLLAVDQRDLPEMVGQVFRLVLAPIGNVTGRLPLGNTGRANVSAFAEMPYPDDLADALLQSDETGGGVWRCP